MIENCNIDSNLLSQSVNKWHNYLKDLKISKFYFLYTKCFLIKTENIIGNYFTVKSNKKVCYAFANLHSDGKIISMLMLS